jgi:hypothetical protein
MDATKERDSLVSELSDLHAVFPRATIERLVQRIYQEFHGARVTTYLPILVRRVARSQLLYLDPGAGPHPSLLGTAAQGRVILVKDRAPAVAGHSAHR